MLLYVIRHGETQANKEGRFQGWTDNPLNEKGVELARETGKGLRGVRFDGCYSSPLIRAVQTAQYVLTESGNPEVPIRTDERIKEINMGDWEGRTIRTENGTIVFPEARAFFNSPLDFPGFPNGETAGMVCQRTQEFLRELAAAGDDKTYLISLHGFAMRAMLNFLYEDPSDFWQQHVPLNCEVNILEVRNGEFRFVKEHQIYYDAKDMVDRYAGLRK
ncbi:MAG: histidine phosphatase family protein [Parasporobacterium sp.]|nr:histidine phosphatase family protein [Parasporobacterium sp.]